MMFFVIDQFLYLILSSFTKKIECKNLNYFVFPTQMGLNFSNVRLSTTIPEWVKAIHFMGLFE